MKKYFVLLPLITSCNRLSKSLVYINGQGSSNRMISNPHIPEETGKTSLTEDEQFIIDNLHECLEEADWERFEEILNDKDNEKIKKIINQPDIKNKRAPLLPTAIIYLRAAVSFDLRGESVSGKEGEIDEISAFIKIISSLINHTSIDLNIVHLGRTCFQHLIEIVIQAGLIDDHSFQKLIKSFCENCTTKKFDINKKGELGSVFNILDSYCNWNSSEAIKIIGFLLKASKTEIESETKTETIKESNDYFWILKWAIQNDFASTLTSLLDINNSYEFLSGENHANIIYIAVKNCSLKCFKILANHEKIRFNDKISIGDKDAAQFLYLLQHPRTDRFNINQEDDYGNNIIYNLVDNYSSAIAANAALSIIPLIKMLVGAGIDVNKGNRFGNTPLHVASSGVTTRDQQANAQIIRQLLYIPNINKNRKNCYGFTPLHFAVTSENKTGVEILLEDQDVKLDIVDEYGCDVFYYALGMLVMPNHTDAALPIAKKILQDPRYILTHKEPILNILEASISLEDKLNRIKNEGLYPVPSVDDIIENTLTPDKEWFCYARSMNNDSASTPKPQNCEDITDVISFDELAKVLGPKTPNQTLNCLRSARRFLSD